MDKYNKIFWFSLVLIFSFNTKALSLTEALEEGYVNNDDLKTIRVNFLSEIEKFPAALAEFMPKIFANVNVGESNTKFLTSKTTLKNNNISKNLTLEQPIFDGFGSVAGLKAAQAHFRSQRGHYYSKEQENILKEIETYLTCIEYLEKYNISKISVRANKTQLNALTERFRLGEATETEVAAAREGYATAQANEAMSYSQLESIKATFLKTFGVEPIDLNMPINVADLPPSLFELMELAKSSNPAIEYHKNKLSASKADEINVKSNLLPTVSLKVQTGNNLNMIQDDNNRNKNTVTTSLNMNVPILAKGGAEYSNIRKAKNETKKNIIALDGSIKDIENACKSYWAEYQAGKSAIIATNEAVKAAEVAYNGMIQEEMLGSKTIVEVLASEEKLSRARSKQIEAKKSFILSGYKLKSVLGELTAKALRLNVEYFEPESEFKKVKMKVIGF